METQWKMQRLILIKNIGSFDGSGKGMLFCRPWLRQASGRPSRTISPLHGTAGGPCQAVKRGISMGT